MRLIGAAVLFAVLSTILFALGPAWSLSRPDLTDDLKLAPGRLTRRVPSGSVLVVAQLSVSLALVVAGGLFARAGDQRRRGGGRLPARAPDRGRPRSEPRRLRRVAHARRLRRGARAPARAARRRACVVRVDRGLRRRADGRPGAIVGGRGRRRCLVRHHRRRLFRDAGPAACCADAGLPPRRSSTTARCPAPSSTRASPRGCSAMPIRSDGRSRCASARPTRRSSYTVIGIAPPLVHDLFESPPNPAPLRRLRIAIQHDDDAARANRAGRARRDGARRRPPRAAGDRSAHGRSCGRGR